MSALAIAVALTLDGTRSLAGQIDSAGAVAAVNAGYAFLQAGRLDSAEAAFGRAVARDPRNRLAHLELGYLLGRRGNWNAALREFEAVLRYNPGDAQAQTAAAVARANLVGPPDLWVDALAFPVYQSRFGNLIGYAEARAHRRLLSRRSLTALVGAALTGDTRSNGGNLPAIFSDNVLIIAAGLSLQPAAGTVAIRATAGVAVNLIEQPAHPDAVESDFRAAAFLFRRWSLAADRRFGELNGSVGWYSRFDDNTIAYLTARGGARVGAIGGRPVFAYGRLAAGADANGDFYNNVGEVGLGLEWRIGGTSNASFRVEGVGGVYFGVDRTGPNPYGPSYGDVRVALLVGRRWVLRGGGR